MQLDHGNPKMMELEGDDITVPALPHEKVQPEV